MTGGRADQYDDHLGTCADRSAGGRGEGDQPSGEAFDFAPDDRAFPARTRPSKQTVAQRGRVRGFGSLWAMCGPTCRKAGLVKA